MKGNFYRTKGHIYKIFLGFILNYFNICLLNLNYPIRRRGFNIN